MVLAGEDATDRSCLRVVLEDTCPEMCGRLVEIADPVRLHRHLDRDTSLVADPEAVLRTHCVDGRRRYSVTDAPTVLAKAVELREIDRPRGRNRSLEHFTQDARTCCAAHLRAARPR